MSDLRKKIEEYSEKNEETKSQIVLNDIKIQNFINKKITPTFSVNVNLYKENKKTPITAEINEREMNETVLNELENSEVKENSNVLLVSEKSKKVFLPYTKNEIIAYLEQYPNQYKTFKSVVEEEYILPLDLFVKHTVIARFRESYSLIRDRESKSIIEALKYAMDMMFKYELNPAIIAACKTQEQLERYIECLNKKRLEEFKDFEIIFEINPI